MAEAVTTGTEVPHGAEHTGGFPPFESTHFASQLFWLVLTFAALYWFVSRVALPRIASILHERRERIQGDLREANAMRKRAEDAGTAYEAALAEAKAKAQAIGQETHARLAAESEARRKALEADLAQKLAAAEATIADTKAKAMANVEAIATEAAAAIVERILGEAPPPAGVAEAVKTALKG